MSELIRQESIEGKIFLIRGQRVMLDSDLAQLYGVTTARLNQQVRRNLARFPSDFMFQMTRQEFEGLMLQTATSKVGRGGRRKLPYVFTEHGAVMLASVLNSPIAINASIEVVRAFTRLRQMILGYKELQKKIKAMERKYDGKFRVVFTAINQLLEHPEKPKRRIGFHP